MFIRAVVIGLLMPAFVLLGNGVAVGAKRVPARPVHRHVTVNVYGCGNIIATHGSVLTVGDHSPVNANTGDVSSGGTLGIDTDRSSLESGAARFSQYGSRATKRHARPSARSTAISGYEDHSVHVIGKDQMAVYDDSNLFVHRNGKLNANTGDTDSSGLNAVDVSASTIRSGNHMEDDENDDEKKAADARPSGSTARRHLRKEQAPSEGESRANRDGALTIGGDGYDNLGVGVTGKRNIAVYDDSNVVVGGTGDVNAQIGDSDTSGAVVMGIRNSTIESGNST